MTGLFNAFLPQLRGLLGGRAVARVLKRHSAQVANDVILPDGRGGLTQIDHLALTASAILVIETKHYSGLIFGRAHEPHCRTPAIAPTSMRLDCLKNEP